MPREVVEAMSEAAEHFVDMNELLEKAGERIAEMIGVDAAFITAGASAAMAVAVAACMTGMNPAQVMQLPDTTGLRNEIVELNCHRVSYDQAIRITGAQIVGIGYSKRTFEYEVEGALTEKTAAILYFAEAEKVRGSVPIEAIIDIGRKNSIPVIVNAAAELPPASNLTRFTAMGASLVIFSGGKDICGPQSSGLILGDCDLIRACALNSCPNHSVGRSMKVTKETVVGLVKAVELYLMQDFSEEMAQWETQVNDLVRLLENIPHVVARRGLPTSPGIQPASIPRVYLDVDFAAIEMSRAELLAKLAEGSPSVFVGESSTGIVLNPQMLSPSDEVSIAQRIRDVIG